MLSTAHAIVIKDENIFFLSRRDGSIPLKGKHGLGLYYDDCRFLSGHQIIVANAQPIGLASTAASAFMANFELCNDRGKDYDGRPLKKRMIGIQIQRIIDSKNLSLLEKSHFTISRLIPLILR
jgi:hypothetical protein